MPPTALSPASARAPSARTPSARAAGPRRTVERFTLPNGLRVVVAPDRAAPVVGVNVSYDVGFRSEPQGRTGFAHLFEHLMFQGSGSVGKMEHARLVQGAGGVMNGSTHPDYTNYFEALPTGALELALFLEADRMRAPRLTQENLANQISVVQEEIRVNVLNQPYGGFPWITLPPVAFESFANTHDGYGGFADLEAATLADAADFFERYYAPGNAVLAVAGDVDADELATLVERHFGDIEARPTPPRPDFGEPWPTAERRGTQTDPVAPQPALALGWRVPDPVGDLAAYLPVVVLAEVLAEGDASRLQRRLVLEGRLATSVSAYLGTFGDPFDGRDPVLLTVEAHHPAEITAATITTAVDVELDRLATDGLAPGELERVRARLAAQLLRSTDGVMGRTNSLAVLELLHGRAELLTELPGLLAAVPAADVVAAAAARTPATRAVLELVPAGGDR